MGGRAAAAGLVLAASEGCYDASRAAALSGVPKSTVYYWARTKVITPSVSPVRDKLWSYADLMALRIISWLRHPKERDDLVRPPSPMPEVRRALRALDKLGLDLWSPGSVLRSPLVVDRNGKVHIHAQDHVADLAGQVALDGEWLDLLGPFGSDGGRGPDLVAPRPHIRIVPARVAGEPHVVGSRLTTMSLTALARRGIGVSKIANLYDVTVEVVEEALDLERQLAESSVAA